MLYEFATARRIVFGPGRLRELPDLAYFGLTSVHVAEALITKPFIPAP